MGAWIFCNLGSELSDSKLPVKRNPLLYVLQARLIIEKSSIDREKGASCTETNMARQLLMICH